MAIRPPFRNLDIQHFAGPRPHRMSETSPQLIFAKPAHLLKAMEATGLTQQLRERRRVDVATVIAELADGATHRFPNVRFGSGPFGDHEVDAEVEKFHRIDLHGRTIKNAFYRLNFNDRGFQTPFWGDFDISRVPVDSHLFENSEFHFEFNLDCRTFVVESARIRGFLQDEFSARLFPMLTTLLPRSAKRFDTVIRSPEAMGWNTLWEMEPFSDHRIALAAFLPKYPFVSVRDGKMTYSAVQDANPEMEIGINVFHANSGQEKLFPAWRAGGKYAHLLALITRATHRALSEFAETPSPDHI